MVKCKNCFKENVCAKVIHLHRGKKRECVHFVEKVKKASRVPIRTWLQPDKIKSLKEAQLKMQVASDQAKLQQEVKPFEHTEEVGKIEVGKKPGFWEKIKRSISQ